MDKDVNQFNEKPKEESSKQEDVLKLDTNDKRTLFLLILAFVALAGLVIAGLLWVSTISEPDSYDRIITAVFEGDETENSYLYNNFVFVRPNPGALWTTTAAKDAETEYLLTTYYAPRELENISIDKDAYKTMFNRELVYFSKALSADNFTDGPAKVTIGAIEVGKIVGTRYGVLNTPTKGAFAYDDGLGSTWASCDNATDTVAVVEFIAGNETRIVATENCIQIYASTAEDFVRAGDRLLFQITGIMR
ncbi:MAG: hypothetical protein ACI8Y7_001146 [Candidatus Woesearchaeota archaeon]|jgi:hypothetical protein